MKKTNIAVAAALAVATTVTGVVLAAGADAATNGAPAATAGAAAAYQVVKPVDAADPAVRYTQKGGTVTVTRKGKVVATVTLKTATYTATSGSIALTVTAKQAFVLHTGLFVLYDRAGGENDVTKAGTIRIDPGTKIITLDYTGARRPEALGWVPQDGEGGAGVWELAGTGVVKAADRAVAYRQSGKVVTATRKGKPVATVALRSATVSKNATQAQITVTAKQPFLLDTALFVLYDAKGGENSAGTPRLIRVESGTHTFGLRFGKTARPQALGWVPQDGEGGAGTWTL